MDVDKEKIAIAVLRGTESEISGESVIRHDASTVRKCFAKLQEYGEVFACYEAGCFGFELYRQLTEMGVACMVAAPAIGAGKKSTSDSKSAESAKYDKVLESWRHDFQPWLKFSRRSWRFVTSGSAYCRSADSAGLPPVTLDGAGHEPLSPAALEKRSWR